MAFEPDLVEAAHDKVAAFPIFFAHFEHGFFPVAQSFDCRFLRNNRSAKNAVLVDFQNTVDNVCGTASIADAEARHRVSFGKTVQENGAFPHSRNRGDGRVVAVESQLGINFVGNDEHVFFDGELGDLFEQFPRRGAAGRIRREVNQKSLYSGLPGFAKGFDCDGEFVFRLCFHGDGFRVAKFNRRAIRNVARLVVDDFVARIENCAQHGIECFGNADRRDNFRFRIVFRTVIGGDVFGNFFAQRNQTAVVRVTGVPAFKRGNCGVANMKRRNEIRFADPERNRVFHL